MDYDGLRTTIGNNAGEIPFDHWLRKQEVTPFYEDPYATEDHFRKTLIDYRPSKPWLASDQIRRGDDPHGGHHSREKISLLTQGHRTGASPRMPEGTFLDHDFSWRDPRGASGQAPDMKKYRDQGVARLPFIKLSSDADYSIPESMPNPEQMQRNIKGLFYPLKERLQIFSTARGGWHNGGTGVSSDRGWRATSGNGIDAGVRPDLADVAQGNRRDATSILSASPYFAQQWGIPDHRMKVAKYGHVRGTNPMAKYDQQIIRVRQQATQRMTESNGHLIGRNLGILIADAEGLRMTKQLVTQGIAYGDSSTNRQRGRVACEDINKLMHIVSPTQNVLAHEALSANQMLRKNNHQTGRKAPVHTQFNHKVAESLEQAVTTSRSQSADNLRRVMDKVEQSAADNGIYCTVRTRANRCHEDTDYSARNGLDARYIADELVTSNYAGVVPMSPYMADRVVYEHDVTNGFTVNQRGGARGPARGSAAAEDTEVTQALREFGLFDRANRADPNDHIGRKLQGELRTDTSFETSTVQKPRLSGSVEHRRTRRAKYGGRKRT